jgi:hypothetical protein
LDRFQQSILPFLESRNVPVPADWDRVAPAIYRVLYDHRDAVQQIETHRQWAAFEWVYGMIRAKRREMGDIALIGAGRPIVAFFHPQHAEEAKRIEYLADEFGTRTEIFRGEAAGAGVAQDFLKRVGTLAREGKPATVWIWSHATKDALAVSNSNGLSSRAFVDHLVRAAAGDVRGAEADFSDLYWMVDTCYATDFMLNVTRELESSGRRRGIDVTPPELMVTSATRDRVAWHKSFPEAIARQYLHVKNDSGKRWKQLKLRHILREVDFYLYCQGRKAVFDDQYRIRRYDVVQPHLLQDLVVLIRLRDEEIAPLRRLLGLPADAEVNPLFQIGRAEGAGFAKVAG